MTDFAPSSSERVARTWLVHPPTLAGFGFSIAWLIGLSVFAASTTVVSTGTQIIAAYSGHAPGGVLQYLFTEGLPPVAILVVVGALARSVRQAGYVRLGTATWIAALVGSIISFAQFALGIVLVTIAVPAADASLSAVLSDSVTRLDGAKMLLFASMAITVAVYLVRAQRARLRWLLLVSVLLAATIVVSGLGYLLIISPLATAADASLPLLLVWMTGFGIVLGRSAH
jgi:hypothetical protein